MAARLGSPVRPVRPVRWKRAGSSRHPAQYQPDAPPTGQPEWSEVAAWRTAARTVLLIAGLVGGVWLAVQLRTLLVQAFLAVILAAGLTPLVDRAVGPRRPGLPAGRLAPPRAAVVLLLYLGLAAVLFGVGALVVPPVVSELEDLLASLPGYASDVQEWLAAAPARYPLLPWQLVADGAAARVLADAAQLPRVLTQAMLVIRVALGVLGGALDGVAVLVLAVYLTQDAERIRGFVVGLLPTPWQTPAARLTGRVGERLGGWLRGQILLSAVIGAMTLVGLSFIGVRYAALLALLAAAGEVVPMVGPIVSAVPAIAVALLHSPGQAFLTLTLYAVVQQLENHLIVPRVMGHAVALHPLVVLLALLAGSELLGVTGAVLAVPIAATAAVLVGELRTSTTHPQGDE